MDFSIYATAPYAQIATTVTTRGGFALYLNGEELRRYNLPAGTLTVDTKSVADTEQPISIRFAENFAGAGVGNQNNHLCVEVHTSSLLSANEFNFNLEL